ncbi:hypothetical protein A0H81_03659 [Grifola frondosa]|uniref:Uncharacterized protein n=1 Tax=Grifola frondosa TaxID=5627 RepID=A0A1C7MK36_GRIFR|nr:hypothetical protein A0H81_03659 [Grifola frondosa]
MLTDAQFAIIEEDVDSVIEDANWVQARVFIEQHHPLQGFLTNVAWYPSGLSRHFQITFPDLVDFSQFLKGYLEGMVFDMMQRFPEPAL